MKLKDEKMLLEGGKLIKAANSMHVSDGVLDLNEEVAMQILTHPESENTHPAVISKAKKMLLIVEFLRNFEKL